MDIGEVYTVAKLTVQSVTDYGFNKEITLHARYDEKLDEDRRFSKATPNAKFAFSLDNPNVEGLFVPNRIFKVYLVPEDD